MWQARKLINLKHCINDENVKQAASINSWQQKAIAVVAHLFNSYRINLVIKV